MALKQIRPHKYTSSRVNKILRLVRGGNNIDDSALLSGISPTTLYAWKEKYPEFESALGEARAYYKRQHINNINDAGFKHWQASAWMLERKHWEEYGKRETIQHKIQDGAPLGIILGRKGAIPGEVVPSSSDQSTPEPRVVKNKPVLPHSTPSNPGTITPTSSKSSIKEGKDQ